MKAGSKTAGPRIVGRHQSPGTDANLGKIPKLAISSGGGLAVCEPHPPRWLVPHLTSIVSNSFGRTGLAT